MAPIDYSIKDIEKVVKLDGKVKNVEVARLTAPGENFISLVLRVNFEVEKNGHSRTFSSVAKRLPLSTNKHRFDMNAMCMKNEIKFYSEILPLLKDFAKEHKIKLDHYPEYLGSRFSLDSSKQDCDKDCVLILENLIPRGYQNNDRYIGCDFITSKAVLKSLALFHALPIAMKIKKPEVFEIIKNILENHGPFAPPRPDGHKGPPGPDGHKGPPGPHHPPDGKRPQQLLLEEICKNPDFSPYISKVKPLLEKPMTPDSFKTSTKEPWNTITHNDFWVNNVMVNYKNKNMEEPLVKLVDFQLCLYGSYASDLVFFLLSSVRNDVIREYMDDLLRIYYDEFISVLRQVDVDVGLSYEEYLEEVRTAATQSGIHRAITFLTIIFGEKGTGVDTAVEEFDPMIHMTAMMKKMNQHQKDKTVVIASEAIKRNWL